MDRKISQPKANQTKIFSNSNIISNFPDQEYRGTYVFPPMHFTHTLKHRK